MFLDPNKVELIFSSALERSSTADRTAFLDESCAGDAALRKRVEELLQANVDARDFLQSLPARPLLIDDTVTLPSSGSIATNATLAYSNQAVCEETPQPEIPGYEILGELGRGAMGVVYKALQLELNRVVALKMVLAGPHAGVIDLVRFQSEAEVAANLQHPNIVQVYAIGRHGGLPFLSLECIEGGTLSQRLGAVPQLPLAAASLVETLARAVGYAHAHGVVHRDIKPSNILMTRDGIPKVTDFGLAKRVECSTGMTLTGAILGTPSYMSPEQAESKKDIGPAADIYSLGAILYEMLTGRPPFQAPTPMDTIFQVIENEPVLPRRLQPKLPRDLETICLKCLQKPPAKRYASAEDLADDLARFQEGRPILARPVSKPEHALRWCRRNPVVAGLSAACMMGIIAAAILLSLERSKTLENLSRAEHAERDLTIQLDRTKRAEEERTEQLFASYRETADAKRYSHRIGQRFDSLDALKGAARIARQLGKGNDIIDDLRRKAIVSLTLPDLRLEKQLPGWIDGMVSYAIDGKFETYALCDRQGRISVRRVTDGSEILTLPPEENRAPGIAFDFSPDGRYLVLGNASRHLSVWDLDRRKYIRIPPDIRAVTGQCFTPNSRQLVVSSKAAFAVYNLPGGELERSFNGTKPGCGGLVVSPDGSLFAALFPVTEGSIQIWALDSGKLMGTLTKTGFPYKASWSSDGRLLAVANHAPDLQVHLWDVPNLRKARVLNGPKNSGLAAAFCPGADLVASNGWEEKLRLWHPHTGQQLLTMSTGYGGMPRFNDRGDRLLLLSRSLETWQVASSPQYRTLTGDPLRRKKNPYGGAFSPNGQLLAAGSEDGTMIWEAATGAELAYLPTGNTWQVLFHPSGDLLTSSSTKGLMRWRIRSDPDQERECRIGPPETLVAYSTDGLTQSKDGRVVVVAVSGHGGHIVVLDRPSSFNPGDLLSHLGTNKCSVSPDGKWAATGTWHGTGVRVWSVAEKKLVRELQIEGHADPVFSPDGRWLAIDSGVGLQLWNVGTWEPGPVLADGRPTFSPAGSFLAVRKNAVTTLIDMRTLKTITVLEDPNQDTTGSGSFSPDESLFATASMESHTVHIWDLRRIRTSLKAIDLDWDAPPYPVPSPAIGPLKIHVENAAESPMSRK